MQIVKISGFSTKNKHCSYLSIYFVFIIYLFISHLLFIYLWYRGQGGLICCFVSKVSTVLVIKLLKLIVIRSDKYDNDDDDDDESGFRWDVSILKNNFR